jgi:hypothetical protein
VTLDAEGFYLGLSFVRFLGGEDESGKFYTSTLDAELGYEYPFVSELVAVRPMLGFGVAQPVTIQSDNAGYPLAFHLAPGVLVALALSPMTISAEVRQDMVIADEWFGATTFLLGAGLVL